VRCSDRCWRLGSGLSTASLIYPCLAGVTAAATLAWLAPAALACLALGLLGFFLGPIFPLSSPSGG
jgi:hypothetical protein